jgi:hypothetical protein
VHSTFIGLKVRIDYTYHAITCHIFPILAGYCLKEPFVEQREGIN